MYNIVILAEQALTPADAAEVVSLHEEIEDTRHYHVLIPCEDAALRASTAMGTLAASEVLATPPVLSEELDVEAAQQAINEDAGNAVNQSVAQIRALGLEATGEYNTGHPVDALTKVVADKHADEVIVMTLPHSISELFHLDWTSKARRRLGVPVLHLLEHEPLDAEAGEGQGITGM
jgi:hypothetical protein